MIRNNIENLKQRDFYSVLLFALFKIKDIPEYSALSQLSFVLDKDNLLNFCEYFGGTTITVPTMQEMQSLVYSLLLYQYVNIDKMDYDAAIELIGHDTTELREVKRRYSDLCDVLNNYSFVSQEGVKGSGQY